jgi:DNA gyrase/topoisomerase IV subunit B
MIARTGSISVVAITLVTTRYLKGLGSLSLEDWEWVMTNKSLISIEESEDSKEKLEMAFGDSSELRKRWLSDVK